MSNFIINLSSNHNPCENLLFGDNSKKLAKENSNSNNEHYNDLTNHETRVINNSITHELPQIAVTNVVSTVNLGLKLNLDFIDLFLKNVIYKKGSKKLTMKIKEPKATAIIYNTGKLICTGATSEEDSRKAAKIFAKIIKAHGYDVQFNDYKVDNISAIIELKFEISLKQLNDYLYSKHNISTEYKKDNVYYNPEIFSGLIYPMENPKLTAFIFSSGQINFVGAKERKDIDKALEYIYPLVVKFKKENKENEDGIVKDFDYINNGNIH